MMEYAEDTGEPTSLGKEVKNAFLNSYSLLSFEDFAKSYLELRQISGGECETHDIQDYARSEVLEADTSKKSEPERCFQLGTACL